MLKDVKLKLLLITSGSGNNAFNCPLKYLDKFLSEKTSIVKTVKLSRIAKK
jgi:hypothetical protein